MKIRFFLPANENELLFIEADDNTMVSSIRLSYDNKEEWEGTPEELWEIIKAHARKID